MLPLACGRQVHTFSGFTLLEMIITMVVLGVISVMVAGFIRAPVLGYVDSVRRAELTDVADYALRRMAREVRLSLPNSLRITTSGGVNYIEFIATSGGGRYRAAGDGVAGNALNFSDPATCAVLPANCQFDAVGVVTAATEVPVAVGDSISVYNLGQDAAHVSNRPADSYAPCNAAPGCNRAVVSGVAGTTITLTPVAGLNVFAQQQPPLPSPSSRFHVIPGGTLAVTYACPTVRGVMRRYDGYGLNFAQVAPPVGGTSVIMANNASCSVTYESSVGHTRAGMLTVALTLFDSDGVENITLMRQIHLDNSP